MKNIAMLAALVAVSTTVSTAAFAAGCAKPRNAFDQVYCAGNLFTQVDKDLNTAYASLRQNLNPAQKDALKQGQLSWIGKRDAECSEEKSNGYYVNLSCAIAMTESRLAFLKERERECSSTGCESDKLTK